jgi:hypothetical protein
MAAKQHGTAYVYGVETTNPTAAQILSISVKNSDRNNDKVPNSSGQITSERDDDELKVLEMEIRYTASYTKPAISAKMTIAGGDFAGDYKVTSTDDGRVAQGLATYRITAEQGEYMAYS